MTDALHGVRGSESITPAAGTRVQLLDLCRSFGPTRALDHLSLTIEPGELVALLGPSGCGKTTALRVLAGFETLDSGQLLVDGKDISSIPAQKRDMGMVFQSYSLFPNMNALDNVAFGLRMRGQNATERRTKAASLLEMVGLSSQAQKFPHQMSGGQQQRVALARALAIEPRVLLLDEPLSALDAKVRLQLREQIRVLQTRLHITTVFVTHDQEEALSMADRVCVMRAGRIEQVADPTTLYASPANSFVAEFVGVMNRIPAEIRGGQVVVFGTAPAVRNPDRAPSARSCTVLVRPENLRISPVSHGDGIVMTKTFLGATTRVSVLLGGDLIVQVDRPSDEAAKLDPGASVEVSVGTDMVMIADSGPNEVIEEPASSLS